MSKNIEKVEQIDWKISIAKADLTFTIEDSAHKPTKKTDKKSA